MAIARSKGFNAITITGGETMAPIALNYFKDRKVAIVYDNDDTGILGAKKIASILSNQTDKIKIVTGFHEVCKEPKEDITDFGYMFKYCSNLKSVTFEGIKISLLNMEKLNKI